MLVCVCVYIDVLGETLMSWEQTATLVRVNIPKSALRATGLFSHWHNIILLFFTSSGELVHTHTHFLSLPPGLFMSVITQREVRLSSSPESASGAVPWGFVSVCVWTVLCIFGTAHILCLTVSFCFCFLFYSFCYCVKKRDSVCLGVPCG